MKQWIKVNGLEQIPQEAEIANATLIRKNNNYYINITTYQKKEEKVIPDEIIGIDFGCETQLTPSNGIKIKFQVPISKRLKRLDRKIMKNNRKKSKNKTKDQMKRKKEYEKITNKKTDIRNKIVNAITSNFKYVCFQDENISAWKASNHGKKIQNSSIGSILADLKNKSANPIVIDKFFPSTQLCPNCHKKNKISLKERTYSCECGYTLDRDVKSAIMIRDEGLRQIPTERREFKLGEILSSVFMDKLSKISSIYVSKIESLSQEASILG